MFFISKIQTKTQIDNPISYQILLTQARELQKATQDLPQFDYCENNITPKEIKNDTLDNTITCLQYDGSNLIFGGYTKLRIPDSSGLSFLMSQKVQGQYNWYKEISSNDYYNPFQINYCKKVGDMILLISNINLLVFNLVQQQIQQQLKLYQSDVNGPSLYFVGLFGLEASLLNERILIGYFTERTFDQMFYLRKCNMIKLVIDKNSMQVFSSTGNNYIITTEEVGQ
ncbi:UNKNOWN [Stylonychia lemnae]|uniref:Uncharacterized protein n=1 Tax=Stylonychia lemnae TaxID=5949 RepID=A0A078B4Q6_STYLE|nr:UNKNOWN [Stylonychia lemnae]|eukprot:CDW88207.1 UNKNOWN [Stylonychia lemnae]